MGIYEELEWRGLIKDVSSPDLREKLNNGGMTFYIGTDPTGDSLHIGHFSSFLISKRLKEAGHHPILLVGGGTGLIGDPKPDAERPMITVEQVQHNFNCLKAQAQRIFGFEVVNNYDWLKEISLLDFLRDYGKLFNVNTMLNKEVVASRLEVGISYTEFTYQILQAIDFHHLLKTKDVQLQIGGADQWGNITAGIDLIHKMEGSDTQAFALTIPLMLKADGTKFGKTAGGAVWLDAEKTTPYEFYQFWLNQDDRDVVKYLKYFTFLDEAQIAELEKKLEEHPELREAQRCLAKEVTEFVHGKEAVVQAEHISKALFSGEVKALTAAEIEQGFKNMPTVEISSEPENIVEWLVNTGIEKSKRQAREDVTNGAIYINGDRIQDLDAMIDPAANFDGKFVIARRGKKRYFLARVTK